MFGSMVKDGLAITSTDKILVDTSVGASSITLPASPGIGAELQFVDSKGTFGTNNLTLLRNGKLVNGGSSDFSCTISGMIYRAVFTGDSYGWLISAGGGGGSLKITAVTGTYSILASDVIVRATGASTYTVTLPLASAANSGQEYIIKSAMNTGVSLTLGTTSSQTIDGMTTLSLARFESVRVVGNGSGWDIISDAIGAFYA